MHNIIVGFFIRTNQLSHQNIFLWNRIREGNNTRKDLFVCYQILVDALVGKCLLSNNRVIYKTERMFGLTAKESKKVVRAANNIAFSMIKR